MLISALNEYYDILAASGKVLPEGYSKVKIHYLIALTEEGNIDGIKVKIYDRERVVCDCLRHVNTMDGEVFNIVIQRYIGDKKKDAAKLMMYASKLGVEKKARRVIGIWL